jgi:hypothetical protein
MQERKEVKLQRENVEIDRKRGKKREFELIKVS